MIKFCTKPSEVNDFNKSLSLNEVQLPGKFSLKIILGYSAAYKAMKSDLIGKFEFIAN